MQHVFNEKYKRLEPTNTQCEYCGTGHFTRMGDNHFQPLFKVNDRTNIIVYSSVKFNKLPVGIPRCTSCKNIHVLSAGRAAQIAWGIAIATIVLWYLIWDIWAFFGIIICPIIGFVGTMLLTDVLVKRKGIYTKLEGAKRNETVQDLVINGWSLTQPSA